MEGEGYWELATTEVGLVEGLAPAGAAFEHFEVFANGIVFGDFCSVALKPGVENVNAGVDEVADVAEEEGRALLTFLVDIDAEGVGTAFANERGSRIGCFFADFVAADVGEADGVEDCDAVDDPTDLRFPVDGFENAAGGGRSDDVVGDALDLHFGTGEEGVVAGDFECDGRVHWELY